MNLNEFAAQTNLPLEVAKRLRAFVVYANKSTGSSHPSDQKLWFRFIAEVLNWGGELKNGVFREALRSHDWQEDKIDQLVLDFEFGLDLLKFYTARIEADRITIEVPIGHYH